MKRAVFRSENSFSFWNLKWTSCFLSYFSDDIIFSWSFLMVNLRA